jgi:FemAB-related protein (PEP-CTERM system-associated)
MIDISTPSISIKKLVRGDVFTENAWDVFVEKCQNATFFHRSGWQNIINDVFQHQTYYLYAEIDDLIVAVLPLAHVNSFLFGKSLTSLPFAVYAGVAFENTDAAILLEDEAYKISQKIGVDYVEFKNIYPRHSDWPSQDIYVTFRKKILPDVEGNLLEIPRKQRAMVRKGIKNNLTSQLDTKSDRFFSLYADNVHRHGTPPMSKKYFDALLKQFEGACEILTVVDDAGNPVSSVFSFYFRDEVLPYYAGDNEKARDLAANDFKYWELLRRSCLRGNKIFDFGRSKIGTGSFSFKRNWGFEATPLAYEYRLLNRDSVPQNNPLNSKYRLLIAAWRKLPIGAANFIGPFIVRNLG